MHQFEDATLEGEGARGSLGSRYTRRNKGFQLREWSFLRFDTIGDLR